MASSTRVTFTVNDRPVTVTAPARTTAADALRDEVGLTGVHLGCEHGVCGACTVLLDGTAVRSCILYVGQLEGHSVTTVEGLAGADGSLHPVQEAFRDAHGLQCGFCTPGLVLTIVELLREGRGLDDDELRAGLSGNLCRCTGYAGILDAARRADETWDR